MAEIKEIMQIAQCTSFRKNAKSKSFPAMVASLFPRNQLESARIWRTREFQTEIDEEERWPSFLPPLPRRHVNRMKRLLEATLTPAIKPETPLGYNKTGSRTRRPIEMGYESSAVEIRARRGLLTWWNKRSPVKMDESS